MLVLVRGFSYAPDANYREKLYTPDASFSEGFLLYSSC